MSRSGLLSASLVLMAMLACAVALLAVSVKPAEAAFPGRNGEIAFQGMPSESSYREYVYGVQPNGTGLRTLLPVFPVDENFREYNRNPAWSPDGTKLVANGASDYGPQNHEVFLANADGSDVVNVTESPTFHEADPAFFPSGQRLVFCGSNTNYDDYYDDSEPGLYARSLDQTGHATGPMKRLTFSASDAIDCAPSVSPDGKKIAFVRNGGIFVMRSGTPAGPDNVPVRLTGRSVSASNPDWSPDGRRIVYQSAGDNRMMNGDIWMMNPDGSGKKELGPGRMPAFSPDGRMIAFGYSSGGSPGIWKMQVDGTKRTKISPDVDENGESWMTLMRPSWQPLP